MNYIERQQFLKLLAEEAEAIRAQNEEQIAQMEELTKKRGR